MVVSLVLEDGVNHGKVSLAVKVGVLTNDNPIGLNISNEIVSIRLGWSGYASELRLTSVTMDSHDLKMRERFNMIVHNNTIS